MHKFKSYLIVAAALVFVGLQPVMAQQDLQQLLLQANPALADQIQKLRPGNSSSTSEIPRARSAVAPTTRDLSKAPEDVDEQAPVPNQGIPFFNEPEADLFAVEPTLDDEAPQSVYQRYYQILTGAELPIFGTNLFDAQTQSDLVFFNTVGRNYVVAHGDILRVTLRGVGQSDDRYEIGQNGMIILPDLPPIQAAGQSLADIEQKITDILRYDDAAAAAFVSLDTARLIAVQVTGAVNNPGVVAVPAYTPLSRVLMAAGGVLDSGALRDVRISDSAGRLTQVDLYAALRSADRSADPVIKDAARIYVADKTATFGVAGFVPRPGVYELPPMEEEISVRDALSMAGVQMVLPGAEVDLLSFADDGFVTRQTVDLSATVPAGAALELRFVETRDPSKISVIGAVMAPYSIRSNAPVPIGQVLRGGASLAPDALLSFAMRIPSPARAADQPRALNLRTILAGDDQQTLLPGDRLFVFTQKQFAKLVAADPNDSGDPLIALMKTAKVAQLFVDGQRVAYLAPGAENHLGRSLADVYGLGADIVLDVAIAQTRSAGRVDTRAFSLSKALSQPQTYPVEAGASYHIFNNAYYQAVIADQDGPLAQQKALFQQAGVVQIFVDNDLTAFLPSDADLRASEQLKALQGSNALYPLYALHSSAQSSTAVSRRAVLVQDILGDQAAVGLRPQDRFDFYTVDYIRKIFDEIGEDAGSKVQLQASQPIDLMAEDQPNAAENPADTSLQIEAKPTAKAAAANLARLQRASRLVSGAVEYPGYYPVAGKLPLGRLLAVAGGVLDNADLDQISIRRYRADQSGRISALPTVSLDLKSPQASEFILAGDYDVNVPVLINDAVSGTIELTGEVLRPGVYTFARDEQLHDVIQRAGGLSKVAYPYGAVFLREVLQDQQRDANARLAQEVEQAVLAVAQGDVGAKDTQVKAVLTYAQQLRNLPAAGRQVISLAQERSATPLYLNDGDKLHIPKRPSHVRIMGNVNSEVAATYAPNKRLSDYLSDAGGLDRLADKKRAFVLMPDGANVPADADVIIPPGAIIIVPPKVGQLSILGLTDVISRVMGNIATSLLAINNVK